MMSLRIGSVVEDFHNVVTDKHVLSSGDELAISAAGVICEALLAIGPVGNQDHHPSSLFDENRMCVQTRKGPDVFMHLHNNFSGEFIRGCFTNNHSCTCHGFSFWVGCND